MSSREGNDIGAVRARYLAEFVQLKADACYVRDYRDYYGRWIGGINWLRAVTSVGSVAGWLRLNHLGWLWATLLVAAQLAEHLQRTFPITKRRLALSRWCRNLNELIVRAQGTWEDIESGRLTAAQIRKELKTLRTQQNKAQAMAIPNGLPKKAKFLDQAYKETASFFQQKYDATIE